MKIVQPRLRIFYYSYYSTYYMDKETGLYYLQSRYYNPEWSRFINADIVFDDGSGLLSTNLYAYCSNNPVMLSDPDGHIVVSGTLIVLGFAIFTMFTLVVLSYYVSTPQFRSAWSQFSNTIRSGFANLADKIRSVFVPMANRINRALSRSMDKAINYIRRYGGYSKYFVAYAANLKGGQTYFPAPPVLSFSLAAAYVLARGNVFASSKNDAKKLAAAVGNFGAAVGPEKHGGREKRILESLS